MLVWLTLPFYDFCGFRSVAVNSVYKLQFFTFIMFILFAFSISYNRFQRLSLATSPCCALCFSGRSVITTRIPDDSRAKRIRFRWSTPPWSRNFGKTAVVKRRLAVNLLKNSFIRLVILINKPITLSLYLSHIIFQPFHCHRRGDRFPAFRKTCHVVLLVGQMYREPMCAKTWCRLTVQFPLSSPQLRWGGGKKYVCRKYSNIPLSFLHYAPKRRQATKLMAIIDWLIDSVKS